MPEFTINDAIQMANQAVTRSAGRHLSNTEVFILRESWERNEYDQIAAKHQYATSYISQDVAPKLWKLLSDALGEKVKKSNFKAVLESHWEQQNNSTSVMVSSPIAIITATPSATLIISEEAKDAPYIDRPPVESLCYETLLHPGALVRIKAPRLMGKTLLVFRILSQLTKQGSRTVYLSLRLADRKVHFSGLDKFLRWFCINVGRELELCNQLDQHWDEEGIGSKVSCTTYFEEYLLSQSEQPLVLCLDDIDLLFPYPEIYEDFFTLLRSWYEKARSRNLWKRLRLIIVHSTDAYIRLNINQSPFNIGVPIELPEFTKQQALALAQQCGLIVDSFLDGSLIQALIELVGGHPYLLKEAFVFLYYQPNVVVEEFLKNAATEAGIYRNHLREHWIALQQEPNLAKQFWHIVNSTTPFPLEPVTAYKLQSMGLIKLQGNSAEPRCQLYRFYFQVLSKAAQDR